MTNRRPPKKSAMLEVRLSHEAKEALMARCRAQGVSASEFVRQHIEEFVAADARAAADAEPQAKPRLFPALDAVLDLASKPQAAFAAVAMALGIVVLSSPSVATPNFQAIFERFDGDRDGALSPDEFEIVQQDDKYVLAPTPEPIAVPIPCDRRRHDETGLEGGPDRIDPVKFEGLTEEQQLRLEQEMARFDAQSEEFEARMEALGEQVEQQAAHLERTVFVDRESIEASVQAAVELAQTQAEQARAQAEAHAELIAHSEEIAAQAREQAREARAVAREAVREAFTSLDRNRDGRVTDADFDGRARHVQRLIQSLDDNGDGAVTREEFQCP